MSDEIVSAPAVASTALPKQTTADDLLSMYEEETTTAKEEVTSEAEKQLKVQEEIPKLEAAKKLADAAKELPVKEEEQPSEVKKEVDDVTKAEEAKVFKARFGDKDIDVPEEASILQKINGKDVPVKIRDAVTAFTKQEEFNRNMDKRLSHVSAREKRWEADQTSFKTNLDKLIEVAQKGDFVTAIRGLAKVAAGGSGLDVAKFEQQYFEQLDKVRELYSSMTPEQRKAFFAEREANLLKEELKARDESRARQDAEAQLTARVQALQKELQSNDEEFWGAFKLLAESQVGNGKAFQTANDIQPEDVAKFITQVRHEEKVLEAGQRLGIEDEALLDEVSRLTIAHPEFSVDDVVSVIERAGVATKAPPSVVENLNRKAQQSKAAPSQANSTKKKDQSGLDDEDVQFLYRQKPKAYKQLYR